MNQISNQSQEMAIHHFKGPMLVIAGPGSGKTYVITKRVQFLVEEKKVDPSNILVITFTKAAAMEMQERFTKLAGNSGRKVSFGTFHAVFFKILKTAYGYNGSNILKEETKYQIFQRILEDIDLEYEDENEFIQNVSSEISAVKNERIALEHFYPGSCGKDIFNRIYNTYDKQLRNSNLLDFDDMLLICYELLKERQDILAAWQKKYQYILIDEFQDINQIQYDVMKLLAKPNDNLFIVGDDDQSIYRFRGAKPEIMLNFLKDYQNADKIVLNRNYRSTEKIIKASSKVIMNNQNRFAKEVVANRNDGENVRISCYETQSLENQDIINKIMQANAVQKNYSETAILFRTNMVPRSIIGKLIEYNLPFKVKDKIPNLFDHWITKNILTYIRISLGNEERKELLQIINKPNRYIKRESLYNSIVKKEDLMSFYKDKDWMQDRIDRLYYDFSVIQKMNPFAAVNYIRKGIGYDEYLKEYAANRNLKAEDLMDIINELEESAKQHKTFQSWFSYMEEYTKQLKTKQDKVETDAITLATFHGAKGLEFDQVYIIDAIEGVTPYKKAILPADIEEERRMFYVAMTRAKNKLQICYAKEYLGKKTTPSQYIRELLES